MQLKVKQLKLSTGGPLVAVINKEDAKELDLFALDRIKIKSKRKEVHAILDISNTQSYIKKGEIGLFEETYKQIKTKYIQIIPSKTPKSIDAIRKKLDNKKLTAQEINSIIQDISTNKISDIEIAYFVSACYNNGLNNDEVIDLIKATLKTSKTIKIRKKIIVDKHCTGGVPNNRTSMLIIPILAATGLTIIKTSSRAITSPAGTADTMEVLAKVSFPTNKIKEIVKKTNACLVWGGSMDLASTDSRLIKIRHPLKLDPEGLMIASILAKKLAVGSTHLLIDIPYGENIKIKTKKEAKRLKKRFSKISKKLNLKTKTLLTDGSQPIGNGIGPALEARDILYILTRHPNAPRDLEEKAIMMANKIFKLTKTKASAKEILESGKAYEKFREIIKAQKGNPNISPEKISLGKYSYTYKSPSKGKIMEINNVIISKIARLAGAPENKGAGVYLHKKVNDIIKKNEPLFTIYAENKAKLEFAKSSIRSAIKIKKEG